MNIFSVSFLYNFVCNVFCHTALITDITHDHGKLMKVKYKYRNLIT